MPHLVQQETTLAYLENQIAAALILQSSHEYHHWLLIYARYLVNEGETCQALRNTLFMSCMCVIALNILLLAPGFWTRVCLKPKQNAFAAAVLSPEESCLDPVPGDRLSGEAGPSADCRTGNCIVKLPSGLAGTSWVLSGSSYRCFRESRSTL